MNSYTTSQVAKIINVHPNTIRFYEKIGFVSNVERLANNYRVFNDFHVEQLKLVRIALEIEVLQNGLRKKVINIIKLSSEYKFFEAIEETSNYIEKIKVEGENAKEAIKITEKIFLDISSNNEENMYLKRKEAAKALDITIDALRNWEMNGLIKVKRKENGYRVYTNEDIKRLKIIKALRCANYSLSSILRMLNYASESDIENVINTPRWDEDIVKACDKLLISLEKARLNGNMILDRLIYMNKHFKKFNRYKGTYNKYNNHYYKTRETIC